MNPKPLTNMRTNMTGVGGRVLIAIRLTVPTRNAAITTRRAPSASATRPPTMTPHPTPSHMAAVWSSADPREKPAACMMLGSQVLMPKTSRSPQNDMAQKRTVETARPPVSSEPRPSQRPGSDAGSASERARPRRASTARASSGRPVRLRWKGLSGSRSRSGTATNTGSTPITYSQR